MDQLTPSQIIALSGGRAQDMADKMGEAQERLRQFGGVMSDLQGQTFSGESSDKLISATVTGMSKLVAVNVSARAMRDLDHVEIGKAALEAIGAARLAASGQMKKAFEDVTGEAPANPETTDLPTDIAAKIRHVAPGNDQR